MDFEIIDFHTHPFLEERNNVCWHKDILKMSTENTFEEFKKLGVSKICGSVIDLSVDIEDNWSKIKKNNDMALRLKEYYGDFYVPGFHIHPGYVDESIEEIHRMHKKGNKLIGEIVPYIDGWGDYTYSSGEFSILIQEAAKYNMVINFHSQDEDEMDRMVKRHKNIIFVAAHPGEYNAFMRHIERMKLNENYYLDISGYGIFRYGMLRKAIDAFGIDRILFGSDYPICHAGMYIGGVLFDNLLSDAEKEKIFSINAKRVLSL